MSSVIVRLTMLAVLASSGRTGAGQFDPAGHSAVPSSRTVRVAEPGVVPEGTVLMVRTKDAVNASRELRGTIYAASITNDVLDQDGNVLIPKTSPVELVVRSLSYLGPGGVGASELTLGIGAATVNSVRYPVETVSGQPRAGGVEVAGAPRLIGGAKARGQVIIRGARINVPKGTDLAFRLEDPIRLMGYGR